ncbi:alpha/beta hydrolase [Novosphingobium piscinae]|uniref:Alpha/beta hydrolase fold domain-containing protein n=1 Tax=Novosphingobium piscinae TaxID=1507448 RepID=A0A7X1G0M4_9SPHN|nr:alpha/beta hydrolase [Novosphingobium piscinae]MBC2669817.1 alpha/beta hydrolase fold domain-containing protein [Novosphingobium piscinae]
MPRHAHCPRPRLRPLARLSLSVFALLALPAAAAVAAPGPELPLWPGVAPGSEDWTQPEQVLADGANGRRVINVSVPTMTVYRPARGRGNGTAIIVAPGGGMRVLAIDSGGTRVAEWLSARGFTAVLLKYRIRQQDPARAAAVPRPSPDAPELTIVRANADPAQDDPAMASVYRMAVADAAQAIRLVRGHARDWRIDPARVGILGFSAGGGVAVGTALAEPGPGYPAFVATLFGPALADVTVPAAAPPLFMAVRQDHWNVTPGLVALFSTWRAARKPAELHVYDMANGQIGMAPTGTPIDGWKDRLLEWLALRGFAPRPRR